MLFNKRNIKRKKSVINTMSFTFRRSNESHLFINRENHLSMPEYKIPLLSQSVIGIKLVKYKTCSVFNVLYYM